MSSLNHIIVGAILGSLGAILAFRFLSMNFWYRSSIMQLLNTVIYSYILFLYWHNAAFRLAEILPLKGSLFIIAIVVYLGSNIFIFAIIYKNMMIKDRDFKKFIEFDFKVSKSNIFYFILILLILNINRYLYQWILRIFEQESLVSYSRFFTLKNLKILYFASWEEILQYFMLFRLIRIMNADVEQRGNPFIFVIISVVSALMHHTQMTPKTFIQNFYFAYVILWGQKRFRKIYFACIIHFVHNSLLYVLENN